MTGFDAAVNLICIDDEVGELYAAQEQLEYGRQEWDAERARRHAAEDAIEVEMLHLLVSL